MKKRFALTRTAAWTLAIASLALVTFVACDTVEPTTQQPPFELLIEAMSAPVDASTYSRIKGIIGIDPSVPHSVITFPGDLLNDDGTVDVSRIEAILSLSVPDGLAADGADDDPRCEFINGQTEEEYEEFEACWLEAQEDEECEADFEFLEVTITDKNGKKRKYIIGFHIHCQVEQH